MAMRPFRAPNVRASRAGADVFPMAESDVVQELAVANVGVTEAESVGMFEGE